MTVSTSEPNLGGVLEIAHRVEAEHTVTTGISLEQADESDAGFTLVELLMAITIMGIILVTLGFSVTEGFRNATTSKASIDRSILGNFAARYFSPDVASATYGTGSIVTTSPPACGLTGTPIIDIQTGANSAVSYAVPGGVRSHDAVPQFVYGQCRRRAHVGQPASPRHHRQLSYSHRRLCDRDQLRADALVDQPGTTRSPSAAPDG